MIFSMLLLSTVAILSSSSLFYFESFAQSDLNISKSRDMIVDFGNGILTNAQLTFPAVGKGPFPGVLLIHGSGPTDMNGTLSLTSKPLGEISDYLSERGFAVLKYDKRGIGQYGEIIDQSVWKNITVFDLIGDAKKALSVLIQQPEVDPNKISIIGHSEGAIIATRIAIDNPTMVQNIILMSSSAQNLIDILKFQMIENPLTYTHTVLDNDTNGKILLSEIVNDNFLKYILLTTNYPEQNDTQSVTQALGKLFDRNIVESGDSISIENQIRPILVESFKNVSENNRIECIMYICPIWLDSHHNLTPTFNVIGNVSLSLIHI